MARNISSVVDFFRRRKVQKAALEQAEGSSRHVEIARADLRYLLVMKDTNGTPLFELKYDNDTGLTYLFMGKPIRWLAPVIS